MVVDLYRRWGAAIANANANLRLTRLENLYTRGPTVRAWGARADAGVDVGGFADLGDLTPDTGGAHGPGFLLVKLGAGSSVRWLGLWGVRAVGERVAGSGLACAVCVWWVCLGEVRVRARLVHL